jgi:hypothetical protein
MPFDEISPGLEAAFRNEWSFLAAPGTWFSGNERVQIAAEARRAMAGEPPGEDLPESLTGVVRMVAASSPLITDEWVAALEIEPAAYAEIIGVVARLSAVDLFSIAMGDPLRPLPEPGAGEPSRTPPPDGLVVGKSYVPMVGNVSIPQTISLVPAETVAWHELSDAMYMTFDEMSDPDFQSGLHRTQIELVAARTSQMNECFY